MKRILIVLAVSLLAAPVFAQVTKVETQRGGPCFMWGGSTGSQGQFVSCPDMVTTVTVTNTVVKEVKIPGPVVEKEVIKEVVKEVPAKKIRE